MIYKLYSFLGCLSLALAFELEWRKFPSISEYEWDQFDKRFDCVVGITMVGGVSGPRCIGTFINNNTVVTSANPFLHYQSSTPTPAIHVIDKYWNVSKIRNVTNVIYNLSNRHRNWVKMGFDVFHSPIHDLTFITIDNYVKKAPVDGREPFYLDEGVSPYFSYGVTFVNFERDLRNMSVYKMVLDAHTYEESDEVDCDEYIPRPWGRFICLLSADDDIVITSGAPLFQYGQLRGVGSFTLKKGKENILVFTDFTLYIKVYAEVISGEEEIKKKKDRDKKDRETWTPPFW